MKAGDLGGDIGGNLQREGWKRELALRKKVVGNLDRKVYGTCTEEAAARPCSVVWAYRYQAHLP